MLYPEENKCCHSCGRIGVVTATCPSCCQCVYCKAHGHLGSECPKVPPCASCGEKGHRRERCPILKLTPQKAQRYNSGNRSRPNGDAITTSEQSSYLPARFRPNATLVINPPKHDASEWFKIDSRDLVFQQPLHTMPHLESLCVEFLQSITRGLVYDPDEKHATFILSQGGAATLAAQLYKDIDPNVKDLQGTQITGEALMKAATDQISDNWWLDDKNVGYCDFITDDRNSKFLRTYVGQARNPRKRILWEHIASILRNENDTLHYFMIWVGNGHRRANFLKLWCFRPGTESEQNFSLRVNLMEALFCYAFNSCHGLLFAKSESEVTTSCFGLNIMSPLLQDFFKPTDQQRRSIQATLECHDPQVVEFVCSRAKRKLTLQQVSQRPLWRRAQYWESLREALGDNDTYRKVTTMLNSPSRPIGTLLDDVDNYPYFGSISAPVGLVLDHPIPIICHSDGSIIHKTNQITDNVFSRLPEMLKKTGFNEDNVLAWTFDFKPFHEAETPTSNYIDYFQQAITGQKHDQILKLSQAKIVLLCGIFSEKAITSIVKYDRVYTLQLRGASYKLYVGMDDIGQRQRIYISCPQIPIRIMNSSAKSVPIICEAFKFTFFITNSQGMKPFAISNFSVIKLICQIRAQEKIGGDIMTTNDMHPEIRNWLQRKGFNDITEIQKLEQIAGSLSKGLIALCHVLPRAPQNAVINKSQSSATRPKPLSILEKSAMHNARKFGMEMVTRMEEGFKDLQAASTIRQLDDSEPSAVNPISCHPKHSSDQILESEQQKKMKMKPEKESNAIIDLYDDANLKTMDLNERASEDHPEFQEYLSRELGREIEPSNFDPVKLDELKDHWSDVVGQRYVEIGKEEYETIYEHQTESEISQIATDEQEGLNLSELSTERKLRERKRPVWSEEALVFQGKRYSFRLFELANRYIYLCYCYFEVPKEVDVGDGGIDVFIELADTDQRHPEAYAIDALNKDIGKCLAFKVIITDSHGHKNIYWPRLSGLGSVFRANSCVDKIINKKQSRDLIDVPRRYIPPLGRNDANKAFSKGGFTSSIKK